MITNLIRPVLEPHKVTSGYGWRFLNGKQNFHDGIDYINKNDERHVLAITKGVVIYDQDNYDDTLRWTNPTHSAGNMIIMKYNIHGIDYFIRYLHLIHNCVSISDVVEQGDVLGEYADVGYSFGAHLHFDMYLKNWKKVDPTPIMMKGLS